ncbi:hypothetical protein [Streptomyces sp. CRN 30]|uniref:hypothetical protein n=1 Tax=Streptomyces sp. CRN 30 TaxID=3075613 RepID=UPI002A823874|nr:hypothetical protein [Streptomyces sp. CRN 30]
MTDLVGRLTAWVTLFLNPRGAHRRVQYRYVRPSAPFVPPEPLPTHRSPYGRDTPLDATATNPVRPYLLAHEQRSSTPYRMHLTMGAA